MVAVAFLSEVAQHDPLGLIAGDFLFPRGKALLPIGRAMLEIVLDFAHRAAQFRDLHLLFRRVVNGPRLVVVVQEREEPVILLLRERIVFVRVALRALDGQAEDAFPDGVHAVEHRVHAELLGINRALHVAHRIAEKTRRRNLLLRRAGQLITRELFNDEAVVRHVAIEGVDDIIAKRPLLARHVLLVTVAVRVARRVEPVPSPTLAVMRRIQQPLDLLRVGVRRFVGEERIHLREGRRQTREVEMKAADQSDFVGLGRGLEFFEFEFCEDEMVERIANAE